MRLIKLMAMLYSKFTYTAILFEIRETPCVSNSPYAVTPGYKGLTSDPHTDPSSNK